MINIEKMNPDTLEIDLPVSSDDPYNTVRLTIRRPPQAIQVASELGAYIAAPKIVEAQKHLMDLKEGTTPTDDDLKVIAGAFAFTDQSQTELIRWSVVGHKSEDFKLAGAEFPFEKESVLLGGTLYDVASKRTINFYKQAGLFGSLVQAINDFKDGTTPKDKPSEEVN